MLFNSVSFLIFLPFVFILYWFVFNRSLKKQNLLVLTASYFFYGWWSWKFLILLALSTLLDYFYAFGVASSGKKRSKLFLWLSIVNNLGILGVFKYYNFFTEQFSGLFATIGIHTNPIFLQIVLPVGISFYTFHGMSYVFDVYKGIRKPVTNFIEYAVFVSFFPLLVAGPIERANHLLPQVQSKRAFNFSQAMDGCRLMLWGMFKKVVIADGLAVVADEIFNNYAGRDACSLLVGAIAFSFQIYGDFSGYSDIALGTAKLFGFELLSNFKYPYFSRNIPEFWRRWHISLSSWFKDYLYIPLGGSRQGKLKAVRNTFIIFLISGFWHGAGWNYIVWGLIHACGFLPFLLLNRNRLYVNSIVAENRVLPTFRELSQMTSTFLFVTVAWIFFRSHSLQNGVGYIKQIFVAISESPNQVLSMSWHSYFSVFFYIATLIVADWSMRRDERILKVPKKFQQLIYLTAGVLIFLSFGKKTNFIYFQF